MRQAIFEKSFRQSNKSLIYESNNKKILVKNKAILLVKKVIWLYFFLLIFEGALRKWVLPQLSTPLLIVRDPIALWLIFLCFKQGLFKFNFYILGLWGISLIALFTAVTFGHGNIFIALYGMRIFILHFPVIFIIESIFDKEDVVKIGKVLLVLAIPMTILMVVQFYSPQDSYVNRGLAGDSAGAGFSGALGFYRPPGTFSFISGLIAFYGLASAYILYFWIDDSKSIKRLVLFITTGCLLVAIPLSISRSLFFGVGISIIFAIVILSGKPKYLYRIVFVFIVGIIIFILLSNFSFFQTGIEAFTSRFESASDSEGGTTGLLFDRFFGGMFGAILGAGDYLFFGKGIGLGTNAGAMMMTGSNLDFLVSEGEWGRLIGEMGLLLGLTAIYLRLLLIFKMTIKSYQAIRKGNLLPWLILSFALLNVLQGQWAQPTALGFAVFSGGLVLASLKLSNSENERKNLSSKN